MRAARPFFCHLSTLVHGVDEISADNCREGARPSDGCARYPHTGYGDVGSSAFSPRSSSRSGLAYIFARTNGCRAVCYSAFVEVKGELSSAKLLTTSTTSYCSVEKTVADWRAGP